MAKKYEPKTKRGSGRYDVEVDVDLSLELILAEFGGSRAQRLISTVEQEAAALTPAAIQFTSSQPPAFFETPPTPPPAVELVSTTPEHPFDPPESPPKKLNLAPVDEFDLDEPEEVPFVPMTPPPAPDVPSGRVVMFPIGQRTQEVPPEPTETKVTEEDAPPEQTPPPMKRKLVPTEKVVGAVVDDMMSQSQEPILPPRRRGLFSRKLQEETEQLYASLSDEDDEDSEYVNYTPEPVEEECDCGEQTGFWRRKLNHSKKYFPRALFVGILLPGLMVAEQFYTIPFWDNNEIQNWVSAVWLGLLILICGSVFSHAMFQLGRKKLTVETLLCLSALAGLADNILVLMHHEGRGDAPVYALVSGISLIIGFWGVKLHRQGQYEMFRVAALYDNPSYLVTNTPEGARKYPGCVDGFYTLSAKGDAATLLQTLLLPLVLVSSIVLALLCSFGADAPWQFPMALSAILGGGSCGALSLAWALPWANLSAQLQTISCAVAGYAGAKQVSRRRTMVVTDEDLFPPGTMELREYKLFGQDIKHVSAYAAAICNKSGSGLATVFERLRRSESGGVVDAEDFAFCQDGGFSATIAGEAVLLGTDRFMRKMDIRLPIGLNLPTGVFLAIDGTLVAVFAVKYLPSEHVDHALRLMRRNGIHPILAVRDPNITISLLRRKFGSRQNMTRPPLTERLALSELTSTNQPPHALVLRSGLLPYVKTMAGGRRLCAIVKQGATLGILGSFSGTLLSFYLVFLGAFSLLTPQALAIFTLAWTLPVLLGGLSIKYL